MTINPCSNVRREACTHPLRPGRRLAGWAGALALFVSLAVPPPLVAQTNPTDRAEGSGGRAGPPVHVLEAGRYTLRANAVPTAVLSASSAERHGIKQAPDRAVLNVVILQRQPDDAQVTVPAQVRVRKENLLGQSETVLMREVKENDRVSYLGEFEFDPLKNFRFVLEVRPEGSEQTLATAFEDRFVARER